MSPRCLVLLLCGFVNILHELLLLSGYIEENPGPTTDSSTTESDQTVHALLTTLEAGQGAILSEIKAINPRLTNTEHTLGDLVARIVKMKDKCKLLPDLRFDVDVLLSSSAHTSDRLAGIEEMLNDAQDRSRRCNLVFYGVSEGESEPWCDSEKLLTDICKENLKISLEPKDIQRAHRIGKTVPGKNRPIIVNFTSYMAKDDILSMAFKLKGTTVSLSEGFCAATSSIHLELIRCTRDQKPPFKLRYKKLTIGKKTYYYDAAGKPVKERAARASQQEKNIIAPCLSKAHLRNTPKHASIRTNNVTYSILCTNIGRVIPKREGISAVIQSCDCDIVVLTETWSISPHITDAEVSPYMPGFAVYRRDRLITEVVVFLLE